jgi:hypothetical protein
VLTPSGEIQTISLQPSRIASALVDVPVLLQLGSDDQLFPFEFAGLWAAQFVSAPSVTTDVVPGSAHTYMLHHAGPAAAQRIATWLADTARLPGCTVSAATGPDDAPPVSTGSDGEAQDPTADTARPPGAQAPLPATGSSLAAGALLTLLGAAVLRRRGVR